MRDYWLTQYILASLGWGYLIVSLIALAMALWLPKGKGAKTIAALFVLALASILPLQGYQGYRKEKEAAELHQARLAKAQALFAERCKTAGEKIYKVVEDVESIWLTNLRPKTISNASQYDADDQYGYNIGGEDYIRYYLIGSQDLKSRFKFVETEDQNGLARYTTSISAADSRRYWTNGGGVVSIERTPISKRTARYAIEWKDISTREDRDAWIAGGQLRITDGQTGDVIANRIGYLIETGRGSTAGNRSPWPWARNYSQSCPSAKDHNRVFVEKVLKPAQEAFK